MKHPVVVEDSILEVDALGGLPGLRSNAYLKEKGVQGLLADVEGKQKSARIISIVGFHDGNNVHLFKTVVEGKISQPAFKQGEPSRVGPTPHPFGGGFNQVFKLKTGKTLAEHTAQEGLELGYREPNFRNVLEKLAGIP